jgi:hypothetical protein
MAKITPLALVVSLVAGVAKLALQSRADAASGHIPSLNAKVTALRFFETPYNAPPREQREYGHRFEKGTARCIGGS